MLSPLKRHILIRLLLAAGLLSALLLVVFLTMYRSQMIGERSRASLGFNLLLQAALENAMLKRDVPGLAEIVSRMGSQPGIRAVMILNPAGEVRFSSTPQAMGMKLPHLVPRAGAEPWAEFVVAENGADVLRSINPVRNKAPCAPCHGQVYDHPVNGILVVDYIADEIRTQAWRSALLFSVAGVVVLALIMLVLWRSLSSRVLGPVAALGRASEALERGDLQARAQLSGTDELAELGRRFDRMAQALETQMARIKDHEAYLQEILDSLPDGIRVISAGNHRVVLVNRAFARQLGRDASSMIGQPCYAGSHAVTAPCASTLVVCPLAELHQVGDALKSTHRHVRADGTVFPAEVHAALVEIGSGDERRRYVVESIRDLGETVSISHEQRLSELGLLAAGIAHEIHNPLASVRLGVQGLTREAHEHRVTQERVVDYMTLIDQEIDNCIAVTRRLLLLARPPTVNLQLVVVNEALSDTLKLLAFDAQARSVEQCIELPGEPLRLLADEAEVRMILLNLVQNAHHALPSGGRVVARLRRDGNDAVIEISDNGIGMAPEFAARVFDPFFSRRADGIAGTGLGLTIVRTIVNRLKGEVDFESEPGKGTCFRIRLPLVEASLENE